MPVLLKIGLGQRFSNDEVRTLIRERFGDDVGPITNLEVVEKVLQAGLL